jgi:hypothetical protein
VRPLPLLEHPEIQKWLHDVKKWSFYHVSY